MLFVRNNKILSHIESIYMLWKTKHCIYICDISDRNIRNLKVARRVVFTHDWATVVTDKKAFVSFFRTNWIEAYESNINSAY